ncbi:MAG TPA: hypothetical protein VGR74_16980, partial [Actinomycetota bacterium]|nr:hypothetical protein [Actinomycetota bacterium]
PPPGSMLDSRPVQQHRRPRRGPMVTCPRCGNDAEYLADDTFVLIRCEFCGDDIDAADLVPPGDARAA